MSFLSQYLDMIRSYPEALAAAINGFLDDYGMLLLVVVPLAVVLVIALA